MNSRIENSIRMKNRLLRKTLILLFWIMIWQAGALLVHNPVFFVGPKEVVIRLFTDIFTIDFWKTVAGSLLRIVSGFVVGFSTGILFGILAYAKPIAAEILAPVLALLKSIPIASFVVLLLIWTGASNLAVYVGILVVFPNAYLHTLQGMGNADKKLLEMADMFQFTSRKKFHFLYKPYLIPCLINSMETALGMSFKSGVAAEVIGTPDFSLGEKLYMSKIFLDTAGVFSWTLVIIVLSFLVEKVFLKLLQLYGVNSRQADLVFPERKLSASVNKIVVDHEMVQVSKISKKYQDLQVLKEVTMSFSPGNTYCLMGPSGCGKTTFLNILMHLVKADAGKITGLVKKDISVVFQENRLLMDCNAIENILACGNHWLGRRDIEIELGEILQAECLHLKCSELSIGMQRRVAIVRAMVQKGSMVIMDEPFTGLDEETRMKTIAYIQSRLCGRILLITTHNQTDADLLKGEIIYGDQSGFNWDYGRKS